VPDTKETNACQAIANDKSHLMEDVLLCLRGKSVNNLPFMRPIYHAVSSKFFE